MNLIITRVFDSSICYKNVVNIPWSVTLKPIVNTHFFELMAFQKIVYVQTIFVDIQRIDNCKANQFDSKKLVLSVLLVLADVSVICNVIPRGRGSSTCVGLPRTD